MDYTMLTGAMQNDMIAWAAIMWIFALWAVWFIIYAAISVLMIISNWKIFEKAGQPGWGIFIPIYNIYLMFKVAWRPGGWTRWLLFPPVLIVLLIIMNFDIAKRFNKPTLFGLWLWILPIVFYPILAFEKKAKWTAKK